MQQDCLFNFGRNIYIEVQDAMELDLLTKCIKIFNNEWKSVCDPRGHYCLVQMCDEVP